MSSHKQLQTVQLLVQLLPRQNLVLLEALLALLLRVVQEPANLMTADTLGMLFAPTILAPRKMIAKDLHQVSPNINQVGFCFCWCFFAFALWYVGNPCIREV